MIPDSTTTPRFYVTTVQWEKHADGLYDTFRLAYNMPLTVHADDSFPPHVSIQHIRRFPEGQFVAVEKRDGGQEVVVGAAMTMRTNHPPVPGEHHAWIDFLGGATIENHEPDGEWLYGIEMSVRPEYQGHGIGTMLYKARFDMVQRLNLRGWFAGGRLQGYHRYRDVMPIEEYAEKVAKRELHDPTVTMQMNRGFEPIGVLYDYVPDPECGDAAMLILWKNPTYQEEK
jgi:GNAT superfamily N-acetyltransferase